MNNGHNGRDDFESYKTNNGFVHGDALSGNYDDGSIADSVSFDDGFIGSYDEEDNTYSQNTADDDFFYTDYNANDNSRDPFAKNNGIDIQSVDIHREWPVGPFSEKDPRMGISGTAPSSSYISGILNTNPYEHGKRRAERMNEFFKYDFVADGINDPEVFAKVFPGARPSKASDSNIAFFILLFIGAMLIFLSLKTTIPNLIDAVSTHKAVEGYVEVTATLLHVTKNSYPDSKPYDYTIEYEYEYEGHKYEDTQTVDFELARYRGFIKHGIEGKTFTLYIAPDYPSYNKIMRLPVKYNTYIIWILFVFGVVVVIIAFKIRSMCKHGRFVAYKSNGYTRLKMFKGDKKFPGTT